MRKCLSLLLATGLLASASPAAAELCTIDAVPAATLLLPHFAVDLSKLSKPKRAETTTLVLQNIDASPAMVRVTLWTDLSVPTLAFDLYLTGYDVEEITVHELFRGNIPPHKVPEELDNGLCAPDGLTEAGALRDAHAGRPVGAYGGRCAGFDHGDRNARGYITIDNVNRCGDLFPSDSGYFGSGGVASNANFLTGQIRNNNRKGKYAEIEPLVHIEAANNVAGSYTFYGRYVNYDGSDRREPLGTTWSALYALGASRTTLEVWRDSGAVQEPFQCDQVGVQGWYPMNETQVVPFNQDSDAEEICFDISAGPVHCFPLESGAYTFGSGKLATSFQEGWVYLNLNQNGDIHQSLVSIRQTLESGRRRGRSQATNLTSACGNSHPGNVTEIP